MEPGRPPEAPGPRKRTMCQCHDSYELIPCHPSIPEPQVATQCHDLYPDSEADRPEKDEPPDAEASSARQPAPV
jgi:hypothetical protein